MQFSDIIIKVNGSNSDYTITERRGKRITTRFFRANDNSTSISTGNSIRSSDLSNDSIRGNEDVQTKGLFDKVERRHYKRIHTNFVSNSSDYGNLLRSHTNAKRFRGIHKSILKFFKRISIPVGAVSSSFLFANFAHAEESVAAWKPLDLDFSGNVEQFNRSMEELGNFVDFITKTFLWFKNFHQNIYELSINLLTWTYETLTTVVLQTPIFLFNNEFVSSTSMIFSLASMSIVTLLTIFEGIMKMLKKRHTDFTQILKRLPLVIAGSGFAPFLFEKAFLLINQITKGITALGGRSLSGETFADVFKIGTIDVLGLFLFDIVLIALLIPILLQNGRRWWDLMCLAAVSPFALASWIFDRHEHFFNQWWSNVKRLSLVQLVYALFILMLGLFIYATRFMSPDAWLIKILIISGGLFRLANPPQFVTNYARGGDIESMYGDMKGSAKRVFDTITLKNIKSAQFIKKTFANHKESKAKSLLELRKKHGQRHVKGLK